MLRFKIQMATIAEIIDPELLKKLQVLKAKLENDKEKSGKKEGDEASTTDRG